MDSKLNKIIVPETHRKDVKFLQQTIKIEAYNTVANTAFSNGNTITFRIPLSQLETLENLTLKWTITETGTSNSITVLPVFWFSERIELHVNNGTNECWRTYPEVEYFAHCSLPPKSKQTRSYLESVGLSENYYQGKDVVIPASGKKVFYQHLLTCPIEFWRPHVSGMKGYWELNVICRSTSGTIVSAGSGTASLSNLELLINHVKLPSPLKNTMVNHLVKNDVGWNYLDWMHIQESSQTLTAGSTYTFDLDNIGHKHVPFLIMAIRADGYAASGNGFMKFKHLGDQDVTTGSTLDLLDSTDRSILGGGNAIDVAVIEKKFLEHFDNDFHNRHLYFIPLCGDAKGAIHGSKINGYFSFDGSKFKIEIKPSSAGTACVQTLDCNNAANDGGYYKLAFKGHMTDSLAYNANAAAIKSALEALPSFRDWDGQPLTVTASGALTTDATLTFSAVDSKQPNDDLVQVIVETLNDGGIAVAPEFVSSSVTTVGRTGFTTASTYTIDVYVPYYRTIIQTRNGRVSVKTHSD